VADQEYKVKFTTTADAGGATVVSAALDKVATSTKGAGKEFDKTAGLADQLGKRGSSAKDVYEGLNATLNGGTGAVFGLAKAWHNLTEAIAINPLGAALAIFLALAPALYALVRGFTATNTVVAETKVKFSDVKTAAELLDQVKLTKLEKELAGIQQRAADALAVFAALKALQDRSAKADETAEMAKLNADPSLSPDEKKKRGFAIREKYQKFADAQDDRDRHQKLDTANSAANATDAAATGAEDDSAEAFARVYAINSMREARDTQRVALLKERAKLQKRAGGSSVDATARFDRMQEITRQLEAAKIPDEIAKSPGAVRGEAEAQKGLATAQTRAKQARDAADVSAANRDSLQVQNDLQDRALPGVRRKEANARRAEAGLPLLPEPVQEPSMRDRPVKGFVAIAGRLVKPDDDTMRHEFPGRESVRTEFPETKNAAKEMGDHVGEVISQQIGQLLPAFKDALDASIKKNNDASQRVMKSLRN
jgi:hypothetical protein